VSAAKKIILLLWLVILASLGNASALTPGAAETRVGEKTFETLPTRLAEARETAGRHQENGSRSYEVAPDSLLAAESGTQALEPMANAAFNTGTIRTVAGYDVAGNAGLVGQTYNVNVWGLYATESSQGPFALVNALKGEASAAGASQISITGNAVVNQGLLNISPGVAGRLGLQFQQINPTTILLQGAIH
jgi:hypothetical protein